MKPDIVIEAKELVRQCLSGPLDDELRTTIMDIDDLLDDMAVEYNHYCMGCHQVFVSVKPDEPCPSCDGTDIILLEP